MREGLHAWFTPVPQGLTLFVEGKDGREGKITNHTPLPETKISNNRQGLLRPCIPDGPLS